MYIFRQFNNKTIHFVSMFYYMFIVGSEKMLAFLKLKMTLFFFMEKRGIVVKNKKQVWVNEFMFSLLIKETHKVKVGSFNC